MLGYHSKQPFAQPIPSEGNTMSRFARSITGIAITLTLLILTPAHLLAQEADIQAGVPVALSSCGQSPGPAYVKIFLRRLGIEHEELLQATAQDLIDRRDAGNPIKTLVIVCGASLKGMGAAGVSIEDELRRTAALIEEAKKQGILIIGAHVEGMDRRAQGASEGDNTDEQSIDAVCPNADLLLVKSAGNEDRRFTIISENDGIPLLLYEKNMELSGVLEGLFGISGTLR
ncbi:DUF6305 family protein [Gemmatimonadota bacterium]